MAARDRGRLACRGAPPRSVFPGQTSDPDTTIPASTLPTTTTTVVETTTSVCVGGPTVPSSVDGGATTTRVATDVTLPETGGDATQPTGLATGVLILGPERSPHLGTDVPPDDPNR